MKEIEKQLLRYMKQCETDKVTTLIEAGANVNVKDDDGFTPLHWAVRSEHTDVIKGLIY